MFHSAPQTPSHGEWRNGTPRWQPPPPPSGAPPPSEWNGESSWADRRDSANAKLFGGKSQTQPAPYVAATIKECNGGCELSVEQDQPLPSQSPSQRPTDTSSRRRRSSMREWDYRGILPNPQRKASWDLRGVSRMQLRSCEQINVMKPLVIPGDCSHVNPRHAQAPPG